MKVEIDVEKSDAVLQMLGVGRQLWATESGDAFVERLRSEEAPPPPAAAHVARAVGNLPKKIWLRIEKHQKAPFRTSTGLPFTYEVEGSGLWFFRNGKRINRKLTRSQVEVAISRCPLKSTTEIKDLMDYAYLYAVLMDRRIRGQEW